MDIYNLKKENNAVRRIESMSKATGTAQYLDDLEMQGMTYGAIIMQVPMVDRLPQEFYDVVKDGDIITVNADEGYVEIAD